MSCHFWALSLRLAWPLVWVGPGIGWHYVAKKEDAVWQQEKSTILMGKCHISKLQTSVVCVKIEFAWNFFTKSWQKLSLYHTIFAGCREKSHVNGCKMTFLRVSVEWFFCFLNMPQIINIFHKQTSYLKAILGK